jgi:exopolysaccharide biosynthesis polyprenyl glycosylphosphotransferase
MIFEWSRVSPGFAPPLPTSFKLALILLAGFSLLLLASSIAGGRFIRRGRLSVGLVLRLRTVSHILTRRRPSLERVLILGTSPLAGKLIEEIEAQPHRRYTVVGVVDDGTGLREPPFRYFLGGLLEQLGEIVDLVRPHRIIVAPTEGLGRLPVNQLLEARTRGIVVEDGVEVYERLTRKLAIESLTSNKLIFSWDFPKSQISLALARAVSFLASLVGLIGLAPLFGLIALAIKLDFRGPVFFVQERLGLRGKRFKLIKFRTMRPASEWTSEWVRDNGHRITRIGKWLRKFHLDELPQLVNIARGDMNLVGPRPHPACNYELLALVARNTPESGEDIPYYSLRLTVRPGLTGWAQIRYGYANNVDEETEKLRYDLYYIKHMSLRFDLRILFDTVKIVFLGHSSATVATRPGGTQGEPSLLELNRAA